METRVGTGMSNVYQLLKLHRFVKKCAIVNTNRLSSHRLMMVAGGRGQRAADRLVAAERSDPA
jgi:hypothetical protein